MSEPTTPPKRSGGLGCMLTGLLIILVLCLIGYGMCSQM